MSSMSQRFYKNTVISLKSILWKLWVSKKLTCYEANKTYIENVAYFWTNVNPNVPEAGSEYNGDNYALLNGSGGKAAQGSTVKPTGVIKIGQGFIVQAKAAGKDKNLVFNNSIRASGESIFFDKNADQPKDRFWLKLMTPNQNFNTLLIAYVPNAIDGFELSYDAPLMGMSSDALFSILDHQQLEIQGRQYPLDAADVISLGSNHYTAGEHIISLQETEGIFANGQNIYLKDHQTGSLTNLSEENYTFVATQGLTEDRFEIRYQPEIVLTRDNSAKESIIVYRDGSDFVVKSASRHIANIEVFDASGRLIIDLKPHQNETRIDATNFVNGIYILKIKSTTQNDQLETLVTKKVRK